jgi:sirohydrochlorin ferrochelatase
VQVGFITSARPSVPEAVASAGGRVAIASWLLAPGLFHQRLADMGADLVSEPIGAHPRLVDLVVRRALSAGIVDLSTMLVAQ